MNNFKIKIALGVLVLIAASYFVFSSERNEPETESVVIDTTSASEIKIIAFGDSLTAGYGLPANSSYPAQLEKSLTDSGYDVSVINSGVSGETSRGNLERASFIADQNPDVVILGIGGNDALRTLPVDETQKNIEKTIDTLRAGEGDETVIILLQMQAPLNSGQVYKQEFDDIYVDISEKKEIILVPFLTAEVFLNPDNKLDDGIHYNEAGYRQAIDMYIEPVLREILEDLKNNKLESVK